MKNEKYILTSVKIIIAKAKKMTEPTISYFCI